MKAVRDTISAAALAFALLMSLPAFAGGGHEKQSDQADQQNQADQPRHFQGKPAETDAQARKNLRKYNAKLKALLDKKKLSASDLGKIHRISYTLENAIRQLKPKVDWIAQYLEELHRASERNDAATVRKKGRAYLSASQTLME